MVEIPAQVVEAPKPPEERYIGDDKLLRFISNMPLSGADSFNVAERIYVGAKIGEREVATIDSYFEAFFRAPKIVEKDMPAVDMPVWELRKAPQHRQIINALIGQDDVLITLGVAHFYQTMEGKGRIGAETNLFDGHTNIGYACSPIARPGVENDPRIWALTWYVSKTHYKGKLCIGAAPWDFFARCSTLGRVFSEYVAPRELAKAPTSVPATA